MRIVVAGLSCAMSSVGRSEVLQVVDAVAGSGNVTLNGVNMALDLVILLLNLSPRILWVLLGSLMLSVAVSLMGPWVVSLVLLVGLVLVAVRLLVLSGVVVRSIVLRVKSITVSWLLWSMMLLVLLVMLSLLLPVSLMGLMLGGVVVRSIVLRILSITVNWLLGCMVLLVRLMTVSSMGLVLRRLRVLRSRWLLTIALLLAPWVSLMLLSWLAVALLPGLIFGSLGVVVSGPGILVGLLSI